MYFGQFSDKFGVASAFELGEEERVAIESAEVLFANYGSWPYDGNAFVVFTLDGKLYEVNGSHCSCYGLERQWKPEETTWKALAMRKLDKDYFNQDAREFFARLIAEHTKEEETSGG